MLRMAGSRATRMVCRRSPLSQTSAGRVSCVHLAVGPGDHQMDRHRDFALVEHHDVERVAAGGHGIDGLIQFPGLEEPGAPEPGQVPAGHILEGVEEVVRRGVLVRPSAGCIPCTPC